MRYVIESQFDHCGLPCMVIFNEVGFRTAYVGVPITHKLYKKRYDDYLDDVTKDDLGELKPNSILDAVMYGFDSDPRAQVGMYFQVHGGINFSDFWEPNPEAEEVSEEILDDIPEGLWWFGFSANHIGDEYDLEAVRDYFYAQDDEEEDEEDDDEYAEEEESLFEAVTEMLERLQSTEFFGEHKGEIRTKEFMMNEVSQLAEQLSIYNQGVLLTTPINGTFDDYEDEEPEEYPDEVIIRRRLHAEIGKSRARTRNPNRASKAEKEHLLFSLLLRR